MEAGRSEDLLWVYRLFDIANCNMQHIEMKGAAATLEPYEILYISNNLNVLNKESLAAVVPRSICNKPINRPQFDEFKGLYSLEHPHGNKTTWLEVWKTLTLMVASSAPAV